MRLLPFRSVFSKLFASAMLALILFAIAMVLLTKVLQGNNNSVRSEILAGQVVEQITPFLYDLNDAPNELQSRFMLAIIKKSFDIFDQSLDAKMGIYNSEGRLLTQTDGSDLPKRLVKPPSWFAQTFPTLAGVPPTANARVFSPAGYTLLFEPRRSPQYNALTAMFNLFTGTLLLLVMMAIALWWIAHSMTWRINHMSRQMQQLGEGDFSARVTVSGNDEITTLAKGFNQSAEKIEKLINANNLLLAHASHEFRTPITRIRLQVEMMDMIASELDTLNEQKFKKRATAITRDLTGLNDLIESILLVSRLDAGHALQKPEKIDLFELIQQEVQHFPSVSLYGEKITLQGQSKLLTHLFRNLLNNAIIHGIPPVTIFVYGTDSKDIIGDHFAKQIPSSLLETLDYETARSLGLHVFADTKADVDETQINISTVLEEPHSETDISSLSESKSSLNPNKKTTHDDCNNQTLTTTHKLKTNIEIIETAVNTKVSTENVDKPLKNIEKYNDGNNLEKRQYSLRNQAERFKSFTMKSKVRHNKIHKYVAISIIDQGSGIPLKKRQDIFSPFVRLKQEKKGSGLGLSLVAQIVESHNGIIITDTWQGHTRFLVVLPVKTGFKTTTTS